MSETNFFTQKTTCADFFFLKSLLTEKDFNTNFKTETVLTNAYACLDRKSKLFETNLIAIETKELLQRKIYVKNVIFLQNGILKCL